MDAVFAMLSWPLEGAVGTWNHGGTIMARWELRPGRAECGSAERLREQSLRRPVPSRWGTVPTSELGLGRKERAHFVDEAARLLGVHKVTAVLEPHELGVPVLGCFLEGFGPDHVAGASAQ